MCLAVPGKVIAIDHTADPIMAVAEFGGVRQRVCVAWVPEAKVGDYVIVHVGFAISRLDEDEARRTLELLDEGESSDE
ncbi:MAG: HypC/HybG/HupF family hydrogenase formation chaperone [Nitrospirae bacterium]|nr:HypC/HybG/HupF family hydrogenase formation chaperone [Nitrospirota bacterium]